jgi:hypothetical protein
MVVLAISEPNVAVITVGPTPSVLATPVLEMMAAVLGTLEVQLTLRVKSAVLVSEYVPVAVNCCVSPIGTMGALGVTVIDSNPRKKDTSASFVVPDTKNEFSTPSGKSPALGETVTTSPDFKVTVPLTGVPFTERAPMEIVTGTPAN